MAPDRFSLDVSVENLHYILQLTILICGYILLRPLIDLGFRRLFATQTPVQPVPQPQRHTSLADELVVEEDLEGDDDGPFGTGVDGTMADKGEWGSTLRRRQQSRFMEYWEAEQARRAEEDDFAEIQDLLED